MYSLKQCGVESTPENQISCSLLAGGGIHRGQAGVEPGNPSAGPDSGDVALLVPSSDPVISGLSLNVTSSERLPLTHPGHTCHLLTSSVLLEVALNAFGELFV